MEIKQFYDEGLAHLSYAIIDNKEIVLIDPARNPQPYYAFAEANGAKVVAVIETHPHADFVSSHLEIHQTTGASIYVSELVKAEYPHIPFDDGDQVKIGDISLHAINTPGHSPDSISVLLEDVNGNQKALFTGDTLLVGDVGRPDLRGNSMSEAQALAKSLYHSTREKIATLAPEVIVYPAHGPGSLCGKNIGSELQSTIAKELDENTALQEMSEEQFVELITADQPWIPKYFQYAVALNKRGAEPFEQSIRAATDMLHAENLIENTLIIDTRTAEDFRAGHHVNAINIPDNLKFETWLGSVVAPSESFYLIGYDKESLHKIMEKVAKIGYEKFVNGLLWADTGSKTEDNFDQDVFEKDPNQYTVLDVRNDSELSSGKLFENSVHIPLPRLRESLNALPADKDIVVHCAGGLRSAIGSSILSAKLDGVQIWDMGTAVKKYSN